MKKKDIRGARGGGGGARGGGGGEEGGGGGGCKEKIWEAVGGKILDRVRFQ